MRILKNDGLTQQMMLMGAPFEVIVELKEDNSTYSKFAWTSGQGPNNKIHGGTMCTAMISVEKATHCINYSCLKKWFGIY